MLGAPLALGVLRLVAPLAWSPGRNTDTLQASTAPPHRHGFASSSQNCVARSGDGWRRIGSEQRPGRVAAP
jgi:hypothetical protein